VKIAWQMQGMIKLLAQVPKPMTARSPAASKLTG
jgi:hypothetical protein